MYPVHIYSSKAGLFFFKHFFLTAVKSGRYVWTTYGAPVSSLGGFSSVKEAESSFHLPIGWGTSWLLSKNTHISTHSCSSWFSTSGWKMSDILLLSLCGPFSKGDVMLVKSQTGTHHLCFESSTGWTSTFCTSSWFTGTVVRLSTNFWVDKKSQVFIHGVEILNLFPENTAPYLKE